MRFLTKGGVASCDSFFQKSGVLRKTLLLRKERGGLYGKKNYSRRRTITFITNCTA